MTEFRQLLETVLAEQVPENETALLLSGGVDSLSLGFAAQALGKRVAAYTFRVLGRDSIDSRAAENASRKMGWEFRLVDVCPANLEADFLRLARDYGCRKKTQFECTWPFLYLVPAIAETCFLSGNGADGYFGLSKKAALHFREPKAKFDQFRHDYFASGMPAGHAQLQRLADQTGKNYSAPYMDRRIFDYLIQFDWPTLNRPYQKMPLLRAYPEEFRAVGRRDHANLQLVAGVDTVFESLLASPLNRNHRRRVLDLCRDYAGGSAR